jgi:hypothetical protein
MTTGRGSSALHLIYRQRLLSVFKTLRSALTTLPPLRKQASAGGESSLRSAKVGNGISLTDRHRAGSRPSFLFDLIGLTASMKRPQAGETSAPARACRAAQVVLPRGASRRLGPAGGEWTARCEAVCTASAARFGTRLLDRSYAGPHGRSRPISSEWKYIFVCLLTHICAAKGA